MNRSMIAVIAVIVIAYVLISQIFFTVDQREHAIVLQLGQPIRSISYPGLQVKTPFIQDVIHFDKRVLIYDATPAELLTSEKKQLVISSFAFWRITEPLTFYQRVRTISGAEARLNDIISSELRQEVAGVEYNATISTSREQIMRAVTERSNLRARENGIEVLDVRIKRADLPVPVQTSVFNRMNAERERIAKRYRSQGEELAFEIRAQADKERTIILADAQQKAQVLRGEGDAQAIQIYADAYQRDPEFYSFTRSLEAYQKALKSDATVILSADSDLFRYLSSPSPNPPK